jgi:SMC interacting uncharacterized protein involved in chromosome segregation
MGNYWDDRQQGREMDSYENYIQQLESQLAEKDREINRLKIDNSSMGKLIAKSIFISYDEHDEMLRNKKQLAEAVRIVTNLTHYEMSPELYKMGKEFLDKVNRGK